ncbi:hypothetical protein GP2143_07769 [marine gamma proteobacterium HTCC2143]|jgi:hypothetical protein|uniref:Uncharacterized protein n=1 Tax=marine gamma proteobacterium HTCC2143 TaxID=247633 RepID=A0YCB1_9GAMM|nr:hypothetical protein GP2143_07769 [marine gamma proteobacterium HTCC2143]
MTIRSSADLSGGFDLLFRTVVFSTPADTPFVTIVPSTNVGRIPIGALYDVVGITIIVINNILDMLDAERFASKGTGVNDKSNTKEYKFS